MNQRYLFRGQRTDTKEWVYGSYIIMHHNDERTHLHSFIIPDNSPMGFEVLLKDILVEVIPETIGQCTGLKDKNGKLVYHKDFIKNRYGDIFLIEWNSKECAYCLINIIYLKSGIDLEHAIRYDSISMDSELIKEWEVIGNIHQNKDLLENK